VAAATEKEIELEIAYVLFIDIVGYSKLVTAEQRRLLELLNRIVRDSQHFRAAEAKHRLITVPTGDGMALVFYNTPEAPVQCALEISSAAAEHPELKLRMGIHSGPVSGVVDVSGRANIAGAGINIAQRVMDCGDAGHVLVSKHTAEDLEQYGQWKRHLHDLGEIEVKHGVRVSVVNLYSEEVGNAQLPKKFQALAKRRTRVRWTVVGSSLLLLAGIVGAFVFVSTRPPRSGMTIPYKSIAVLPFENLSEDKANAYFAEGMQDEILTRLSKIGNLKVISRTSTQQYKSQGEDLRKIGQQLGVAHIVEGSVQKIKDAVRVNVQLIQANNDSHLWAETFDRKLTDIFSVESEVARTIADQLQVRLTGREKEVIAAKPTDNPEAYDSYLRGLAYTLKAINTPANSLSAQKYLKEAVRLDPKFAVAWALLSYVDAHGYMIQTLQPTPALREEARQAAETAITLQPDLGEAVLAKGYYNYACLKDYRTAVLYFEEARQSLPNSSQIPELLAYVSRRQGHWDKSESYFQEAEQLDPRNVPLLTHYALLFYTDLRRFREADAKLNQVLNIIPDDPNTLSFRAGIAQAEGDLPRAAALLAKLHPNPEDTPTLETQIYQAILERRPAPMISRLKDVLANPDPALGFLNGEMRFLLGWAQQVAGDSAAAADTWQQARSELEGYLKEQPENFQLIGDLALTNAALGDKAAAFTLAERAMAVMPIEKDVVYGVYPFEVLARVAAITAQPDRACAALGKLLSMPYESAWASNMPLTPALLRLDPMFDPLRNDPCFQKLCEEKHP
jgi:TolB-like protein/class 3 adenylate cyclase/Tfp pilus assembly protein PilF